LLVGGLVERRREDVACSTSDGVESACVLEEGAKALRVGEVREQVGPRLARDCAHIVTARLEGRFHRGADSTDPEENDPHGFLLMLLVR
jgi:hypothetical protein